VTDHQPADRRRTEPDDQVPDHLPEARIVILEDDLDTAFARQRPAVVDIRIDLVAEGGTRSSRRNAREPRRYAAYPGRLQASAW